MRTELGIGVIVGGGNGIGAACCRVMHRQGWRVVVVDRDLPAAMAVADEVGGHAFEVDVRDETAITRLAERIEQDVGRPEGLVVSSGTFQDNIPIGETPAETLDRVLDVNFRGTHHLNRIFGLRMAALGRGSIVNLSSVTGQVSTPLNIYGPSKAAIINLTKSLAGEWGRSGVRVNSVSPGITLVPRVVERRRRSTRYTSDIDAHMALGRCVEPPEVAEAVEFLLSPRASAITGTDLVVDCGWMVASLWHSYGGVRPQLTS
ncbi:SDR family NAD(P)-dependent oxidoreductase [Muricoccus roseus]|uniref:SDR family NAD(P)-dependent oxidoreductase n=1 Tax=Muricoccus roseus TaxID=198092 RepID=UPI0015881475|nr:SDR family oxidoreductase [Roseomonas rosea]